MDYFELKNYQLKENNMEYTEVKPALTNDQMYDAIIEGLSVTSQKLTNDLSTARNEVKRLERVYANQDQIYDEQVKSLIKLLVDEHIELELLKKVSYIFNFETTKRVLVTGTAEFSFETDVSLFDDDDEIVDNIINHLGVELTSSDYPMRKEDVDIERSSIDIEDV